MRTKLIATLLIFTFLLSLPTVAAQNLTVAVDKTSYFPGETVTISGNAPTDSIVTVQVKDPYENRMMVDQLTIGAEGIYQSIFNLPEDARLGVYTVHVETDVYAQTVTFNVVEPEPEEEQQPLTVTTDRSEYSLGGTVTITGTGPANVEVAITITDAAGEVVFSGVSNTDSEGKFGAKFLLSETYVIGSYQVDVVSDNYRSSATFTVLPKGVEQPPPEEAVEEESLYVFTYTVSAPAKLNFMYSYTSDITPSVQPLGASLYRVSYTPRGITVEMEDLDIYTIEILLGYPENVEQKVSWAVYGAQGMPSGAEEFQVSGERLHFIFRVNVHVTPTYPSKEEIAQEVVTLVANELQTQQVEMENLAQTIKRDRWNFAFISTLAIAVAVGAFLSLGRTVRSLFWQEEEEKIAYLPPPEHKPEEKSEPKPRREPRSLLPLLGCLTFISAYLFQAELSPSIPPLPIPMLPFTVAFHVFLYAVSLAFFTAYIISKAGRKRKTEGEPS